MSIADSGTRSEGERQAMEVAEEAREEKWESPSFCGELFAGNFNFDLIYPFPEQDPEDKKIGTEYIAKILDFLKKNHDPIEIETTHEIKKEVLDGLRALKAFGLKIPKEYGGLEMTQTNYNRVVHAVASYCSSVGVLLSAHQSIGVPVPLVKFGTPEQKKKYLPRLSGGEISAFALTEEGVGSDPAQMQTTAVPSEDGSHYILNGTKLWTTNGTIADLLVVMAMTPPITLPNGKQKKQITAFIVETTSPGFEVKHRCQFMGLKGIYNGVLQFTNVKVPKENVLWGVGKGLKLALITLNTGRLTLPSASAGAAKVCYEIAKTWCKDRKQWGASIGEHEAIADKLSMIATGVYALDALTKVTSGLVDRKVSDIRIEAALAKLFSTGTLWKIIDHTLQMRGGRGFESAESLKARGEDAYPVEKLMRDARINTIIEGTSTIQRLFASREALDRHLQLAMPLFNPKSTIGAKIGALIKCGLFYATWYPKQWIYFSLWPRYSWAGKWEGEYLRYIHSMSHKIARTTFHAMVLNGPGLEKKQIALGRIVDAGTNLFVMSSLLSRYLTRKNKNELHPHESDLAKGALARLKALTNSAYRSIRVWPGKSAVTEMSKSAMAGNYDWISDDICNIIELTKAKPKTGEKYVNFKN